MTIKLSKDLWEQLAPLFTDALDMTPAARAAWLKDLDATQPQIGRAHV